MNCLTCDMWGDDNEAIANSAWCEYHSKKIEDNCRNIFEEKLFKEEPKEKLQ